MSTYRLRKLIQERAKQLSWKNSDWNYPVSLKVFLEKIDYHNSDSQISLDLLDRLVALYQSQAQSKGINHPHLMDIESQIYEQLGVQWNTKFSEPEVKESNVSTKPDFNRYKDLLQKLNQLREASEAIVGIEITRDYLQQSRPKHDWCNNFKVSQTGTISYDGNIEELITKTRLQICEQWIQRFTLQCQSAVPKGSERKQGTTQQPIEEQQEQRKEGKNWLNCREPKVLSLTSTANSPIRSRDLLRHINILQRKYSALIGTETTKALLLASRPNNNWCDVFKVSETGSISYCGNTREIVTNSRLGIYKQWTDTFIQRCKRYAPIAKNESKLMASS